MAEEIDQPEKDIPKAIIGALLAIGVVVSYGAQYDFSGAQVA